MYTGSKRDDFFIEERFLEKTTIIKTEIIRKSTQLESPGSTQIESELCSP